MFTPSSYSDSNHCNPRPPPHQCPRYQIWITSKTIQVFHNLAFVAIPFHNNAAVFSTLTENSER
ncbi:hypothetical protein HYC85_011814 [Camellia sinensis]|uniref:Uncharacterized protein n=1 Tax=Camellia sinensis TaxID=4442 RepID=A0A7J7HC22_CAMSI|nr:hypothetical protein HYC85_011814 [Camellia sinensis]